MNMTLGEKIRNARKRKMTQAELAEAVGVHEITIRRWELDKRVPHVDSLRKIATALSIPLSELTEDNPPSQVSQLGQLLQGVAEMSPSLPPRNVNDINKEEKTKDPLTGAEIPPINSPEYSDLIYWGRVVENAKLAAKLGTEQEKTDVLIMLNMAVNAFSKLPQKTSPQNIGVQQNNFNGDNNYGGDIPQNTTAQ